jgi:hypothetical protein
MQESFAITGLEEIFQQDEHYFIITAPFKMHTVT